MATTQASSPSPSNQNPNTTILHHPSPYSTQKVILPPTPKSHLASLPAELLLEIFKILKAENCLAELACLGVTCRVLYKAFKATHPAPISLWRRCNPIPSISAPSFAPEDKPCLHLDANEQHKYMDDPESPAELGELLRNFIGPKYRNLHEDYRYPFVNIDVYGPTYGSIAKEKDDQKIENYKLYQELAFRDKGYVNDLIPSPFDQGEYWDSDAGVTLSHVNVRKYAKEVHAEGVFNAAWVAIWILGGRISQQVTKKMGLAMRRRMKGGKKVQDYLNGPRVKTASEVEYEFIEGLGEVEKEETMLLKLRGLSELIPDEDLGEEPEEVEEENSSKEYEDPTE